MDAQFYSTLFKLCYTILIVFLLTRFLYYPNNGRKEYLFTYIQLATIIALLCILISRVEMSFGFALGIFAIFSLIRYRTAPISPREMTYIFLSTGIAAKNLLAPLDIAFYKLIVTDAFIFVTAGLSEYFLFRGRTREKLINYNNLELIHPNKKKELLRDFEQNFGITQITKIEFGKIDTLKNNVRIKVTFIDNSKSHFDDI